MYYGDKMEAKINIMEELVNRGWKVYGFTPDQSDSMTDYYSPAHWNGIAEKNGFVLVIDQHGTYYSGYEVKEYNCNNKAHIAYKRIKKLEAMMNDAASTENEKESCKVLIQKEKEKAEVKPEYTVTETYPTFTNGNPKGSNWHIEKDGQILAKGNGVFACYVANDHMEPYKSERINKVNSFVNRIEKVLKDSDALQVEVKKVPVTVTKIVEKEIQTLIDTDIKDGLMFIMKVNYTNGIHKDTKYAFTYKDEQFNKYHMFSKMGKRGKASKSMNKSWTLSTDKLNQMLEKGHIAIIELIEVTEYQEKTVFKKTNRKQTIVDTPAIETTEENKNKENNTYENKECNEATLKINDEKNGIEIKFNEKPSTNVIEVLKEMGFRWSSYNSVWWAKQTNERLKFATMFIETFNDIVKEEPCTESIEITTDPKDITKDEQVVQKGNDPYIANIDLNYTYHDVHFKSWFMEIEQIEEYLQALEIPYYIAGNKFICEGLLVNQVRCIEELNNTTFNGGIVFYDNKYNEKPNKCMTFDQEDPNETTISSEEKSNVIYHDFGNVEESATEGTKQEEEGTSMLDFDSILGKFESVEVTVDTKIATDDVEFCKEQESIYKKLIEVYNSFIGQLQQVSEIAYSHGEKFAYTNNNYTYKQDTAYSNSLTPREINETVTKMKNRFITTICYYFMKKYSITIDYEKIQKKYELNVTYNNIVDEIYMQLDGFNFTEKAEKEIKENVKELVRNSDKIEVKNTKLIIDAWFSRHDSIWKEYRINGDKCAKLFNALQHFDNGSIKGNQELNDKYIGYDNERKQSNFERYELTTLSKVKSIKFLKNGKLEIEFISNHLAAMFAKEYCGFKQQSA